MRKLVIRKADGLVTNAIEIEEKANWSPLSDCKLLDSITDNLGDIGDKWDGKIFISPVIQIPTLPPDILIEIKTLKSRIEILEAKR